MKGVECAGLFRTGRGLASYAGKVIAEKITGDGEIFDTMANIPMQSFPGGRFLRNPTMKVGMFYHALLDRL